MRIVRYRAAPTLRAAAARAAGGAASTSRSQVLKPKRSYCSRCFAGSPFRRSRGSIRQRNIALDGEELRAFGSQSRILRRFSPASPVISSACASTPSSEPYFSIHLHAVLGPPCRPPGCCRSGRRSASGSRGTSPGGTPNFFFTPATSSSSFDIVLTSVTLVDELREVLVAGRDHGAPAVALACSASVAMTSSASTPSMTSTGQPSARPPRCSGATCTPRSSGIGVRFAL